MLKYIWIKNIYIAHPLSVGRLLDGVRLRALLLPGGQVQVRPETRTLPVQHVRADHTHRRSQLVHILILKSIFRFFFKKSWLAIWPYKKCAFWKQEKTKNCLNFSRHIFFSRNFSLWKWYIHMHFYFVSQVQLLDEAGGHHWARDARGHHATNRVLAARHQRPVSPSGLISESESICLFF